MKPIKKLAAGTAAGFIATLPMSVAMLIMENWFADSREPLPPKEVTEQAMHAVGLDELEKEHPNKVTVAAHFSYGAAVGALYPVLHSLPVPAIVSGVLYGLIVWAASYLGVLPALGLIEPVDERPRDRNLLMIVAHLVWGASLSTIYKKLKSRGEHTRAR